MKYVFHPAALTEYSEAVEFYIERRVELAQAFVMMHCSREPGYWKERVKEKPIDQGDR